MTRIACNDVGFSYTARAAAVDGVTLAVEPGRVLAIVGPNGAGKSTLLRVLAGLLKPSRGEVTLDERPLASIPGRERARSLAFLAQENACAFPYSVREVVLMGRLPYVGTFQFESEADRAAGETAIRETGLEALADRRVDELSTGERQRVFLAMALAQEPGALLLDEPTVYLDVRHQVEAFRLLRALSRDRGLAVAVVTHDLGIASRFADEVALLSAGRLAGRGAPAEVMRADTLSACYGTAIAVVPLDGGGFAVVPRA